MKTKKNTILFLIYNIIIFFITHHLMIYLHEWTHGLFAWLGGYKSSPFAIYYGKDWLTLWDINEAVDYSKILSDGKNGWMALIALSPTIMEAIYFLIALKVLSLPAIKKRTLLYSFFFWFSLFSLAEFYSYIPIRTLSGEGDIYNFLYASHLSYGWVLIPGTLFVIWGVYRLFFVEPFSRNLQIHTKIGRFFTYLFIVALFFGYYGGVGFLHPYPIDHLLSLISWILIPILMILLLVV